MDVCVYMCVCVCPGITLERLERFQPNLVYALPYVCVRILCMFYIYSAGKMVRQRIRMIHIVEEINLLLLLGNRMVMTSRLATVGQTYPRKDIVSAKM
jgi:hypothetical protein